AGLVVGGGVGDQAVGGDRRGVDGPAVGASPEGGPGAGEEEPLPQCLGQGVEGAEVLVVGVPFAGDEGVQGVVDVVDPLPGRPVAAAVDAGDQTGVVEVGLGDEVAGNGGPRGDVVGDGLHLLEDGVRAAVVEGVDGVETQPVDAVLRQPHAHGVEDVGAHLVRTRAGDVDHLAPAGGAAGGVGPEHA